MRQSLSVISKRFDKLPLETKKKQSKIHGFFKKCNIVRYSTMKNTEAASYSKALLLIHTLVL